MSLLKDLQAYVAQQAGTYTNDDTGSYLDSNYQQGPQSKAYSDAAAQATRDFIAKLSPEQFAQLQAEGKPGGFVGFMDKYVAPIVKGAALGGPLAIGGLGAAGLLNGTALGGAAGFGGATGATGAAAGTAASTLPVWDAGGGLFGSQLGIDSALASTATGLGSTAGAGGGALLGLGGVAAPSLGTGFLGTVAATPGLWEAIKASGIGQAASTAAEWAAKNPGLVSLLGGALATAGGASQQSQQKPKTYAPQPGMQMKTLNQPMLNQSPGTFTPGAGMGLQNSGLSRFGAQGGMFTPSQYIPKQFTWGQQ